MDLSQELIEHFIPLEQICNSILDGVIIVDSNKRFLHWNKSAKEILQDIPDADNSQDWAMRYRLLDLDTQGFLNFDSIPMIKALNGEVFRDYRVMTKNSNAPDGLIISFNGNPIRNGAATVGAIVTFRDITEQVTLSKKLNLDKNMYERMLDLMPCVVFIKDVEGKYIYGNKCLKDILGADSIEGKHCTEYLEKESADLVIGNDQLVMQAGKSQTLKEKIKLKNKTELIFRSIRFPYRDPSGEIIGICAVSEPMSQELTFNRAEPAAHF
mgnify:FL=1